MSASGGRIVDSNVILDIVTGDERWLDWSLRALVDAVEIGPVLGLSTCFGPGVILSLTLAVSR